MNEKTLEARKRKELGLPPQKLHNGKLARCCSRCSLQGKCRAIRAATKEHFRWSIHNLIAHPASEIAWLLGMRKLSDWLHDKSIPKISREMAGANTKAQAPMPAPENDEN